MTFAKGQNVRVANEMLPSYMSIGVVDKIDPEDHLPYFVRIGETGEWFCQEDLAPHLQVVWEGKVECFDDWFGDPHIDGRNVCSALSEQRGKRIRLVMDVLEGE